MHAEEPGAAGAKKMRSCQQSSCSVGVLVLKVKELIKTAAASRRPLRPLPVFNTEFLNDYCKIIPRLRLDRGTCRRLVICIFCGWCHSACSSV